MFARFCFQQRRIDCAAEIELDGLRENLLPVGLKLIVQLPAARRLFLRRRRDGQQLQLRRLLGQRVDKALVDQIDRICLACKEPRPTHL